jgi:hypothetical protein
LDTIFNFKHEQNYFRWFLTHRAFSANT